MRRISGLPDWITILNRWDNRIGESPMKTALLILAVVVWLLLTAFLRSRHSSTHLDVTPDARERIEKAKRR